ncbi:tRNA preQ1(34) S-adenosylmethionine ribosyltransferase-isomerase QueA, partial [Candidatus Roizmanbacteria bacterium CG03_land_8_20_14_0_80_39_12]
VINHLITNFHLPGSSLMVLVDAFAIKNELRFYSFGDAMLII